MLDFIAAGALFDASTKKIVESTQTFSVMFGEQISLEKLLANLDIEADPDELPYAEWRIINNENYFFTIRFLQKSIAVILYHDPLIEELYVTLRNESLYDSLTEGLYKNHGEARICNELKLYSRYSENAFCVLIYDIDFFKKVNDTYGHLAGDLILKELSLRVKTILRDTDVFIRFGGEEFLILLPMTKTAGAMVIAKRILSITASETFLFQNHKIDVTVSIGITSPLKSDTIATLIARADEALYKAKTNGRNRIEYL